MILCSINIIMQYNGPVPQEPAKQLRQGGHAAMCDNADPWKRGKREEDRVSQALRSHCG